MPEPWWLAGGARPLCAGWQMNGAWYEYRGAPGESSFTAHPAPGTDRIIFGPLVVWHRVLSNEEIVKAARALEAGDYLTLASMAPDVIQDPATFEQCRAALEGCDKVEIL